MDDHWNDFDLSDQEVAFLLGIFAARGIAAPTEEEFQDALELMHLHFEPAPTELN